MAARVEFFAGDSSTGEEIKLWRFGIDYLPELRSLENLAGDEEQI